MPDLEVQVLIVGGGGCGLSSCIFLSDMGVDHLLVERHPSTSHLPKAHYLNSRTMEIFRQHGVADDVYAGGMPTHNAKVRYITGLGGTGELDAREIYTYDAFGGGRHRERYLKAAPGPPTNFPQLRLEPVLRRHADERAPGRVRFNHELTSFSQDGDGVTAQILDRQSGEEYTVRAQYLIGADGGRTVGDAIGASLKGPGPFAKLKTMHISADLSAYVPGDALLTHVSRPGTGFWWLAFVAMGPTWGSQCEEWGVAFAGHPDDPSTMRDEDAPDAIRAVLGLPDLEIIVHRGGEWLVEGVVSDRFRVGRVFLAGDAAHRHVPTGGLGLNSAIHDAHNLAWKLAAVVHGQTADAERLLQSYEDERRPADLRNAEWALFTFFNKRVIYGALGVSPTGTEEENIAALRAYLADTPMGETLRARTKEVMETQRTEYSALDVDLGFGYASAAVIADGSQPPPRDPMGNEYSPSTRPGHRLPHAWIGGADGRISTHDLVGPKGGFALIVGRDGEPWRKAAAAAASTLGVALEVVSIGDGGDYEDPTGAWTASSGIAPDGAVLVRPDNHVGFRALRRPQEPEGDLERALRDIISA